MKPHIIAISDETAVAGDFGMKLLWSEDKIINHCFTLLHC